MNSSNAAEPGPRENSLLKRSEIERDVLLWRDAYVTRIDRDMTAAFPELERRLLKALEGNLQLVLTNRPRTFTDTVIRPEVEAWVARVVEPIREEVSRSLRDIDLRCRSTTTGDFEVPHMTTLVLPLAAVMAGIGLMVAGHLTGVTTTFFFFTSVSWPVVLGTAGIGGLLVAAGVLRLSQIKAWLAQAFSSRFTPKLYEALIGEGYVADGVGHASVRRQLQQVIEEAAMDLLNRVDGKERC